MPSWDEEPPAGEDYDMTIKQTKRGKVQQLKRSLPRKLGHSKPPTLKRPPTNQNQDYPSTGTTSDVLSGFQEDVPDEYFNVYRTADMMVTRSSNVSHLAMLIVTQMPSNVSSVVPRLHATMA